MRLTIFTESIWPCIAPAVDHLAALREETVPHLVRAGINFVIILGAACYLEGVFETLLRALLECRRAIFSEVEIPDLQTRRSMNVFYGRLEDDLSNRIGRSVGAAGYNEMFDLLTGVHLSDLEKIKPTWEGITVLFNFRNVLGHGREVSARHFSGFFIEGGEREEFSGSYRKVEDYLKKVGLLDRRFVEAHSEFVFLGNEIADHFWTIARQAPDAVIESLSESEAEACRRLMEKHRNEAGEFA